MIKARLCVTVIFFGMLMPLQCALAQEKKVKNFILFHPHRFYRKFFPNLRIRRSLPDSLYIKTYPNYLSAAMHVLSPAIRLNFEPRNTITSGGDVTLPRFRTNISDIIGFSASYRFVSFGFAFMPGSGLNMNDDYAPSRYRTATIKFTGAANSFQFRYIRTQGFTDISKGVGSDPTPPYRQRPDLLDKEFQFEVLHNFNWKKYSYIAPLTFAQRQIKSCAGFLLKAGIYYDQLSGDSTLVTGWQKPYYDGLDKVRVLRSLSVRLAPGVGGNVVFLKRIYLSLVGFTSYDLYLYKYLADTDEHGVAGRQTYAWVLDGKASLGYHTRRLYAGLRFEAERRMGFLYNLQIGKSNTYAGIEVGYRFDAPAFVRKFYKKTMPPGM